MRRNSTDQKHIKQIFFSFIMVLYLIITSLYTFLPLFAGVFFAYIVVYLGNEESKISVALSFCYLILFDLNHGGYLFSFMLTFFIFYTMFAEKIRNNITCYSCIIVTYVVGAYVGYYLLNSFIAYLLNEELPTFSTDLVYYIFLDSVVAVVLLKGKV